MVGRVKGLVGLSLGVVGLWAAPGVSLRAADTGVLRMTIVEPGSNGWRVFVDGHGTTYTDYQWTGGGDFCVDGVAYSQGLGFMSLNRRVGETGPLCEVDHPDDVRTYTIQIESTAACAELQVPLEPLTTYCLVTPEPGVRLVRAETLFKAKAKSTLVVFIFNSHGVPYRVEATGQISGSSTVKVVTNTGQAVLRAVGARSPVASFPLPFQLQFELQ